MNIPGLELKRSTGLFTYIAVQH